MITQVGGITTTSTSATEKTLAEDVSFLIDCPELGSPCKITICKGFVFDGASIPRWLWSIVGSPFTGRYLAAALLHDALYSAELFSRYACDRLFLEGMVDADVAAWRRRSMYRAVRWFGGWVWDAHTDESVDRAHALVKLSPVYL